MDKDTVTECHRCCGVRSAGEVSERLLWSLRAVILIEIGTQVCALRVWGIRRKLHEQPGAPGKSTSPLKTEAADASRAMPYTVSAAGAAAVGMP